MNSFIVLRYRIRMYEIDEGNLTSLGLIRGVFLTRKQAEDKIKTLDKAFSYTVEAV